jgi:hypothetical protein
VKGASSGVFSGCFLRPLHWRSNGRIRRADQQPARGQERNTRREGSG